LLWQYALQKYIAAKPWDIFPRQQPVKFTHRKWRESTGETGRGARSENQLGNVGKARSSACGKIDCDPMFGLRDLFRTVEAQRPIMAVIVGGQLCG
jgi:hypothetical protein